MAKFNKSVIESSKTENLAGGQAYKHSPEMELVVSVLSTFLEDKYYESGEDRAKRIKQLIQKVKPEFVAKLAILARKEFHLRSITHLLVGELAKIHRGDDLVRRVILKVAERPDDLTEIASYLEAPQKTLPKQVKRGIRRTLFNFSPYQLAKYRMGSKKLKLVDLFNAVHPNPKFATKEQKKAWEALLKNELRVIETWEARLSSGEDKSEVWRDLISENKIGYMALLRNLRNISEQANVETISQAGKVIADPDRVKTSKQLPFRFYNAYENVSNRELLKAISEALEHSLANIPEFDGETLIAVDSSGSMKGDPIKKASIFASALVKRNNADLILYDTRIKELRVIGTESVLTISERIQRETMGGGTETSLVFDYATQKAKPYKRIIILSDNESWVEGWYGENVNSKYANYRKINDPYVFAIDIAGYGTKDITSPKIFHISGWSEKIFDFIKWIEKENQLVEFVNQVEL